MDAVQLLEAASINSNPLQEPAVGSIVGAIVGTSVGFIVGASVGLTVGASVG
jgi:hypothetical protein